MSIFEGHSKAISSVSFFPDERLALSSSYDKTIRIWDLEKKEPLAVLEGHSFPVYTAGILPDGNHIISGGSKWGMGLSESEMFKWKLEWDFEF